MRCARVASPLSHRENHEENARSHARPLLTLSHPPPSRAEDRCCREDRRYPVVHRHGGGSRSRAASSVSKVMVGPTSADPVLQVRAIEDLIAQKVDSRRRTERRRWCWSRFSRRPRSRHQGHYPANRPKQVGATGISNWLPPYLAKRTASFSVEKMVARVLRGIRRLVDRSAAQRLG